MDTKLVIAAGLYVLTIIFGIWVAKLGRPLNTAVFTVHKLAALAAIVFTVIVFQGMIKNSGIRFIAFCLAALAGAALLALFVTGAFLSFEKPHPEFLLQIHRLAPWLALVSAGAAVYLLKIRP